MTETEIILNKLETKGLTLPEPSNPGGSYVSVNIRNAIAYIAIQFPILNGAFLFQGRYGEDLTLENGYQAMQLCALNVLSQIHHKIGFEKVLGLNHMDAYYRAAPDWDEAPKITNGASDLFVEMLQEKGQHSRAIFGVEHLPRHFSVGICCSVTLL
jgi:enamine deaminase RidA (YjgF/YER057c/UK114 family)